MLSPSSTKADKYSSRSHPGLCSLPKDVAAEHRRLGPITSSSPIGSHTLLFRWVAVANKLYGH